MDGGGLPRLKVRVSGPGYRYVLVYFAILFGRYKAGIVTDDMLSLPKGRFVALGALEALGLATGMAAGGKPCLPSLSFPTT